MIRRRILPRTLLLLALALACGAFGAARAQEAAAVDGPATLEKAGDAATSRTVKIDSGYDAKLVDVRENVRILRDGDGEWRDGADGDGLRAGDEIMTGRGKVRIMLRGRGELRLPPNAHLVLKAVDEAGENVSVELKQGRVWSRVTPAAGGVSYSVTTPELVAGVRGTLFKVSHVAGEGSRVAVFEGSVAATSRDAGTSATLPADTFVTVDPQGALSQPAAADPEERKEWDEWDQWALDVHEQIASRFVFGGQAISNLARLQAQDAQRHEAIVQEANTQILVNREGDRVDMVRDALMAYCRDVKAAPTQQQGLAALIEDPGVAGWNGPYLQNASILTDRWGAALHYNLKQSPASGNVYGEVISNGPNGIYSQGQTDDLKSLVPFYTVLNENAGP